MTDCTTRIRYATDSRQSAMKGLRFLVSLLIILHVAACSKQVETAKQTAKPPEPKNQTFRMIDGRTVIALVSSDELEMREGGENIVCKYTKQDGKLRVVVGVLGTTKAKYFNMTPQGLVGENGDTYYEPATYEMVMAQTQHKRQLLVGVWRDENSVCTYKADGIVDVKFDTGQTVSRTWSIEGDVLVHNGFRSKILELTDTTFVFEDSGGVWHAKRVPR